MRDRWDGDARRYGVGDASAFATGAEELVAAMREPNWVAEDPEAHLLPRGRVGVVRARGEGG